MNPAFEFATARASFRSDTQDRADVVVCADALVVVVADGVGGVAGGSSASEAVLAAVHSKLSAVVDPYDLRLWCDVLLETDGQLASGCTGETTAVLVVASAVGVLAVSAGDSEAWVVSSAGRLDRLTASRARQRLGTGRAKPAWCHRPKLDGVLVVATDGLFKHTAPGLISAACTAGVPAQVAQRLVELPRLPSGEYPDDVAVVVASQR